MQGTQAIHVSNLWGPMPFLIFAVEISSRKSVAFRKLTWIVNGFFSFFGRKLHYICLFPPFFWWKYLCQISFFCAIYFLETKLLKNPRKMNSFREYNTFSSSNNFIPGYSFWNRLRNFWHKFTSIILSVQKLNKLGKFW